MGGQPVRDAAVAELFLRSFSQPNQFHPIMHGEAHRRDIHLEAVAVDKTGLRMSFVLKIERNGFVAHRLSRMLQGRNARKKIPCTFVVIRRQHATAAERVGAIRKLRAIAQSW